MVRRWCVQQGRELQKSYPQIIARSQHSLQAERSFFTPLTTCGCAVLSSKQDHATCYVCE
eukprot:918329-Pleurochrysis_carterae.AAC.2